jgi:hypothetical protein
MKVALVVGRGFEGHGVTKFTVEQIKWLEKNNYEFEVYASKDKTWGHRNAHAGIERTVFIKFAKEEETNKLIEACNKADIVFLNSIPSKSHSDDTKNQFKRFLSELKKPVALVLHEHTRFSIKSLATVEESIDRADIIFTHSPNNDYVTVIQNGIKSGAIKNWNQNKIVNFQPGADYDAIRAQYWRPIEETNPLINKWIGRTSSYKGYLQMFKFHNEFLRPNGYITTFEGIDRGPAFLNFREQSEFHCMTNVDIDGVELQTNQPAYAFGPFKNDAMMRRMARSGFGYQLSKLDERHVVRSLEYAHNDVACAGVIPVFRKFYGERCTHRKFGDKLINCKDNGTIWLDDKDMQPAFELLDKLAKDSVLRDEWREKAFEFYKLHQDSRYTFEEMMQHVKDRF